MSFTPIPTLTPLTLPYQETEESVRARMNANVAPDWSRDQGVILAIFREIGVSEVTKLWDAINTLFTQIFPSYATGSFLDAHAASYGLERGTGSYATGLVRFTGDPGTSIPPNTITSVPSTDPTVAPVSYTTLNVSTVSIPASGFIDIASQSENVGRNANCAAGAVSYLQTNLFAPVSITNPTPMVGGDDPEDDPTLRTKILAQAALPVGSGNINDYIAWGLGVPGIGRVDVTPLWDTSSPTGLGGYPPNLQGNGTVGVSVRDHNGAPVDWSLVEAAQVAMDPSRQMLAVMEAGEPWVVDPESSSPNTSVAFTSSRAQIGSNSLALTTLTGAGMAAAELVLNQDLSRFQAGDNIALWLYSPNWANVAAAPSYVRFHVGNDSTTYFQAHMNVYSPSQGTPSPTAGAGWWQYVVAVGQFTAVLGTSVLDWAAITKCDIGVYMTVAQETDADFFRISSRNGAAGYGLAPIGAAVSVYTPTTQLVNVTANVRLNAGVSLTGAAGTANATQLIITSLSNYLGSVAPGTSALAAAIQDAIFNTQGVNNLQLLTPTIDVPISVSRYPALGVLALNPY